MKPFFTVMLLTCLPALAQAQETPRTPEFVAEQKARRLYRYFLDATMPSPSHIAHNLTFRISNDIFSGGDGKAPEFYLMAVLQHDWVEIRYREQASIYSDVYR